MVSKRAQRQLRAAKCCVDEVKRALELDPDTRRKRYGDKTVQLLAGEAWFHLLALETELVELGTVVPSIDVEDVV